MEYIKREIEENFLEANTSFKALMLVGARQVGKTTMLKHLAREQNRAYVTMDREADRDLAQSDPELFFQRYRPPILIDEIQKAPRLFEAIKIICDESDEKGLFWLSGSQSKRMLKEAGDSLAGRLILLKMHSLSQREKLGKINIGRLDFSYDSLRERSAGFPKNNIRDVFRHIWQGGMPDVQELSEKMRTEYFDSYIDSYLMRDAVDDNGVHDTTGFRKMLRACAAFAGNLLNYSDLANAAEISVSTATEWVKILQSMGIIYLLEPYSNNALRRMIKTPKLYFCDTGLAAHLSRWLSFENLMNGAAAGHYFENYVVMELVRTLDYEADKVGLCFYRDHNAKEIDLVLEDAEGVRPLEIKLAAMPNPRETKKFSLLDKSDLAHRPGGIICMCEEPRPLDRENSLIPCNIL